MYIYFTLTLFLNIQLKMIISFKDLQLIFPCSNFSFQERNPLNVNSKAVTDVLPIAVTERSTHMSTPAISPTTVK